MKLKVPRVDGRTVLAGGSDGVIDLDSGKSIGYIATRQGVTLSEKRYPSRNISLFDWKCHGSVETHEECVAFAQGVEAVLNHMVFVKDKSARATG